MKSSGFLTHIAFVLVITIVCGLIYVSVQQSYRSSANDPQLEVARSLRDELKNDSLEQIWAFDTIDIAENPSVFRVLYDKDGVPLQTTGLLDGKSPQLPKGVFDHAKKKGEHIVTWQPRRGVRMAMVVESVQSPAAGFVAAGRSLEETEKRESNLVTMVLLAWLACLGVIGMHWIFSSFKKIIQRAQSIA